MRIKCTIKEMATLIRACENASCTECAFWDFCSLDKDKGKNAEDFIEIVPEDKGEQEG